MSEARQSNRYHPVTKRPTHSRPMAGTPTSARDRTRELVLAVVALGAALRLFRLADQPLWANEAFSWKWAHLPLAAIWGDAARFEYNPPLFFSLQHLWLAFGDSEAALRSLPALFGILTIPLVYAIGRMAGGNRVGLVAALLAATSGPLVAYSQEARTYAFLCFLAVLAVLGLVLFLRTWTDARSWPAGKDTGADPTTSRVLGLSAYAAGTTLALYAHNTAFLLPLLANLVALYWWLTQAGRSGRFAAAWVAANLVPFLLWLWWIPVLLAQAGHRHYHVTLPRAVLQTARLYAQPYVPWPPTLLQVAVPIPLLALVAVRAWRDRIPVLVLLLAFAAGVPVLTYAIGFWKERVLLWSVPFGLVLIAAGICAVRSARRRALVLGVVLAAQAANLAGYYAVQRKPPYDRVAEAIAASFAPGDAVIVFPYNSHDPFAYYARRVGLPANDHMLFAPDLAVAHASYPRGLPAGYPRVDEVKRGVASIGSLAELRSVAARHRRLWLVGQALRTNDPRGAVVAGIESLGRVVARRVYEPQLQLLLVETSS
jgi:mannosyltransferase